MITCICCLLLFQVKLPCPICYHTSFLWEISRYCFGGFFSEQSFQIFYWCRTVIEGWSNLCCSQDTRYLVCYIYFSVKNFQQFQSCQSYHHHRLLLLDNVMLLLYITLAWMLNEMIDCLFASLGFLSVLSYGKIPLTVVL